MAKRDLKVSDAGSFIYPHLTEPDTKFKDAGAFHVKVNMPATEKAIALKDHIDELAAEALADAKKENAGKKPTKGSKPPKLTLCNDMPYREEEDGTLTFSFKMLASGVDKDKKPWSRRPALFDAKGVPIKKPIKIGGGTIGKVAFEADPFYTAQLGAGATLRLYSVQILKLVEWSGRDAAGYGFEVEDGFSADELPDAPDNEFTSAAEADDTAGFDDAPQAADASASDEF